MGLLHRTRRALLKGRWAQYGGAARYLLNDRFVTPLAVGAVNGTYPTPGPGGPRMVTDTDGDGVSITGGQLAMANGNNGWGDPAIWWGAVTRVAGRILFFDMPAWSTAGWMDFGFDSDQAGQIIHGGFQCPTNTFTLYDGAASLGTVTPALDNAADRQVAFVLRAAGLFAFSKGGSEYPTWTMLGIGSGDVSATLYPGIGTHSKTTNFDNIRIPDILWAPTPLVSDSFDRANGAIGTSDGAGCEETARNIPAWESGGATWTVAGNEAVNTPTEGIELITDVTLDTACGVNWTCGAGWAIAAGVATKTPGVAGNLTENVLTADRWYVAQYDVTILNAGFFIALFGTTQAVVGAGGVDSFVFTQRANGAPAGILCGAGSDGTVDNISFKQLTLNTLFTDLVTSVADVIATVECDTIVAGTQAGMVLNLDDATTPANFIIAYHDGINAVLEKCVAGTYTSVISAVTAYAAGAEIRVVKDGTSYSLYYNNAQVGTTQTVADAGIISNTNHGLFSTYSGNQLDNFYVFSRTGYNILDTW